MLPYNLKFPQEISLITVVLDLSMAIMGVWNLES